MRYLYLFLLSLLVACAQSPKMDTPLPPQLANPYLKQPSAKALYTPVKKLTLADGLSSNDIQKIFKDSKGFIWIGTSNGLNRYDGVTIKNYWHDSEDANSILHNNIIDIAEDSVGNILVLTQKGVNWIQPNQMICTYTQANWLLFFYKHKTRAIFTTMQQGSSKNPPQFRFVKDSKNNFWQIDYNEVNAGDWSLRFAGKIVQIDTNLLLERMIPVFDSLSKLPLVAIHSNDSIRFLFDYQMVHETIMISNQASAVTNSIEYAALRVNQLSLLTIGREDFQYLFDPKDLKPTSILLEQNNIWIGTKMGLIHYSKQITLFEDFIPNPLLERIRNLRTESLVQEDGWIFNDGDTIQATVYFKDAQLSRLKLSYESIERFEREREREAREKEWLLFKYSKRDKRETARERYERENETTFFRNYLHQIHQISFGKISLPITQLWIDKYGTKWTIGNNQLTKLNSSRKRDYSEQQKMFLWRLMGRDTAEIRNELYADFTIDFDGIINTLFVDSKKRVWIGTQVGLYQITDMTKGTCVRYAQNVGFQHPQITAIEEDNYGQLWISTNGGGIVVFSPESQQVIHTFAEEDGLNTNSFETEYNAKTTIGQFAFKSERGYAVFHPDSIYRNMQVPTVVVSSVTANEVEKYSADTKSYTFTLPYDSNSLIITPRVLDLNNAHRNKIRYKLEGVDKDYCKPLAVKDLHYPHLAAGEYTLLIQGANSHGVWNPIPTRCHITILPAWWQTWWFRLLVGGGLIVLGRRFFYMRQRHINQKHQRETDALQARVLQAQLNPHFIFNVLTLVQSKIMNEKARDASDLLVRLSKLLRNFLESSILSSHESGQFHEIELEKEIELLKEYIDFERLKNDNRFECVWDIPTDIETSDEKLPPFFIQPYVENAIKHGLLYRNDDQGILTIAFEKKFEHDDSYLVCTVSDNGVGRTQAQLLQHKDTKLHKSRGTELIEKRIDILNSYKYAIQIDPYDNQPSGTKVVIQFKYNS